MFRLPHGLQSRRSVHTRGVTVLWCNGQWIDALEFPAAPSDRGLMHGLGIFETMLAVDGRLAFHQRHLARLAASCARLGWKPVLPDSQDAVVRLLESNDLQSGRARIRLAVTAGSGRVQDLALGTDHMVWMTAVPAAEPPHHTRANLAPWTRNERSALAGLKSASYADNLIALAHADRLGFEETVFLNSSGLVCEAATANVFVVRDGRVRTPSLASGCLPGITREVVMEIAAALGIPCAEGDVAPAELHAADEIFLTSSIRGVMGLSCFDSRDLAPGPVTKALRDAWHAAVTGSSGG
jgi:branched-chain amino acid aminotransferase